MTQSRYVLDDGIVYKERFEVSRDGVETQNQRDAICRADEDYAIAYELPDGVLHKHGRASGVTAWADKTRPILVAVNGAIDDRMGANEDGPWDLVVVSFPPTAESIEALNRLIEVTSPKSIENFLQTIGKLNRPLSIPR